MQLEIGDRVQVMRLKIVDRIRLKIRLVFATRYIRQSSGEKSD